MTHLSKYKTIIFDCDGVILDSNRLKTEAFYEVGSQFGPEYGELLVAHHVANGGISRYRKFEHFCSEIIGRDVQQADALASQYGEVVRGRLRVCAAAQGLDELREATSQARWLVVSGSDQAELRQVFDERGLSKHFDGGIFGSPLSKDDILAHLTDGPAPLESPILFLGDSKYDYQVAERFGLDFLFVFGWTEVSDWQDYCQTHHILALEHIGVESIETALSKPRSS